MSYSKPCAVIPRDIITLNQMRRRLQRLEIYSVPQEPTHDSKCFIVSELTLFINLIPEIKLLCT